MTEYTTTPGDGIGEVTITREFDAPRELIFRCFVEPEHFVKFWGPVGTHVPIETVVIEPWAGGRFESMMVADDGVGEYPMKAVFVEVTAARGVRVPRARQRHGLDGHAHDSATAAPGWSSTRPTCRRCSAARRRSKASTPASTASSSTWLDEL